MNHDSPQIFVFFGMIATGKSTLAKMWAKAHEMIYYNSDVIRKELGDNARGRAAFILTAPGGRQLLQEGLESLGYQTQALMVYGKKQTELSQADVNAIGTARKLLVICVVVGKYASWLMMVILKLCEIN